MALEFIRWGHCDPSVGMSREEYIAAHAEKDAIEAANEGWTIKFITNLRGAIWDCHHPPMASARTHTIIIDSQTCSKNMAGIN